MSGDGTGWMYTGTSKPDPEQYLLGRRIDDKVDPTAETTDAMDWINGVVPQDLGGRAELFKTMDRFAKAREDPMFVIEKQRRSAQTDFKNNPLKMQKIRELLQKELKKDLKKKKKKRKSNEGGEQASRERSRSPRRQDRSPKRVERSPKRRERSPEMPDRSSRRQDRSPKRRDRSPEIQDRQSSRHDRSPKRQDRSPKRSDRRQDRSPRKDRGKSGKSKRSPRRKSTSPRRKSPSPRRKSSSPPPPPPASRSTSKPQYPRGGSGISKKLTPAEMEAKRREMMADAGARDSVRREKFGRKATADTEEKDTLGNEEGQAAFLEKFKRESYSGTSIEAKIKSGIFSKQRTKADLNTFLKK